MKPGNVPTSTTPSVNTTPKAPSTTTPNTTSTTTTGSSSKSTLNKGLEAVKDADKQNQGVVAPQEAQPGDKVAPGKVVNEDGEVEDSAVKEGLKAAVNIGSLLAGGAGAGAGAGASAGAAGAGASAGASAGAQAGAQAAKQGASQAAQQGASQAAKQGAQQGAKQGASQAAKGANAGNKDLLKQKPGGNNVMQNKMSDQAMQKLGEEIDKGVGQVADELEKNEAVKQFAEANKEEFKTVNRAFDTVGSAMSGDIEGVKKNAKEFKKNAKEVKKKQIKRSILMAMPSLLMVLFLVVIVVVIISPFTGGYEAVTDFVDWVKEQAGNVIDYLTGGGDPTDDLVKSIIGDIEGYDSLSQKRKNLLLAAGLAVGKPYRGGGRPQNYTLEGIDGGVDSGGLTEWLIWNIGGSDPGYLSGSAIASSPLFEQISQSELKPGDFGVNGETVGVYFGNGEWVIVDASQGVIRTKYSGFTSFYRYKDIDGGGGGGSGGGTKPVSKECKEMVSSLFPNGAPTTLAGRESYLTTVTIPITTKAGIKTSKKVRIHNALAQDLVKALTDAQNGGFHAYDVQTMRDWDRCVSESGGATCGLNMSQHCYGLAVDINVAENPFTAGGNPSASSPYAINRNTAIYSAFTSLGWGWGGDWKQAKKDYMHFSYMGT